MKSTGNRIKQMRERLGLSRAELAVKLKRSRMTVWRIETGGVEVRVVDLPRIARALKATVAELVE